VVWSIFSSFKIPMWARAQTAFKGTQNVKMMFR